MNSLKPAGRIEVIVLVDNVIDHSYPDREDVIPARKWARCDDCTPAYVMAGHGFAALVRSYVDRDMHQVLYDAGPLDKLLTHNIDALKIDMSSTEAIVMSHGHWDHFGGLIASLQSIGKDNVPVYVHPSSFLRRGVEITTDEGKKIRELDDIPRAEDIRVAGGSPIDDSSPIILANGTMMRSGEVPRKTAYETGLPGHKVQVDGKWMNDEGVLDDIFLMANVREKGLVIVTGCSHAGVINIIKEARRLSGVEKLYGVIGGLHLVGEKNEKRIPDTIKDLQGTHLKLIAPAHCTGWKAQHAMAKALPDAYVNNGVGHLYRIGAQS